MPKPWYLKPLCMPFHHSSIVGIPRRTRTVKPALGVQKFVLLAYRNILVLQRGFEPLPRYRAGGLSPMRTASFATGASWRRSPDSNRERLLTPRLSKPLEYHYRTSPISYSERVIITVTIYQSSMATPTGLEPAMGKLPSA